MTNTVQTKREFVKWYFYEVCAGENTSHLFCVVIKLGSISEDT